MQNQYAQLHMLFQDTEQSPFRLDDKPQIFLAFAAYQRAQEALRYAHEAKQQAKEQIAKSREVLKSAEESIVTCAVHPHSLALKN